ncbi:MAG: S41 family peptidase [Chitinivibrionales bacterium]
MDTGKNIKRRLLYTLFFLLTTVSMQCRISYKEEDKDLLEMQSVWEYCRVLSIYSDRDMYNDDHFPEYAEAMEMESPSAIVSALNDTLHSSANNSTHTFGKYEPYSPECGGYASGASGVSKTSSISSVFFHEFTENTAYLDIDSFTTTTSEDIRFYSGKVSDKQNLIIDLRSNPGGLIDACSSAVNIFLQEGEPYIEVTSRLGPWDKGDTGTITEVWRSTKKPDHGFENKDIVIIIDNNTASAAEIFTVALKDALTEEGRSDTVAAPERTTGRIASYGKSIGQYTLCLFSGGYLKLTSFAFKPIESPDFSEQGIEPDTLLSRTHVEASALELLEPGIGNDYTPLSKHRTPDPLPKGSKARAEAFIHVSDPVLPDTLF